MGKRSVVRPLRSQDCAGVLDAALRSGELHGRWGAGVPTSEEEFAALEARVATGRVNALVVEPVANQSIAGLVMLKSGYRLPDSVGVLTYWAFVPWNGRGLMSCALSQIADLARDTWVFSSLQARVDPANEPSRRLLMAQGFRCQGLQPFLVNRWQFQDLEVWSRQLTAV